MSETAATTETVTRETGGPDAYGLKCDRRAQFLARFQFIAAMNP